MEITLAQHLEIVHSGSRLGYQIMVMMAMIVGGWFIRNDARSWSLSQIQHISLLTVAMLGALAGCAIPGFFAGGFVEEVAWTTAVTPKTVLGGILFSFFAVAVFKRISQLHMDTSDAFARGAVLMMAIGRIGCILQHCCYGKHAHWGVDLGDGVPRIPVQYFEAIGLFFITWFIFYLHQKQRFRGRRLFLVFALYGVLRFLMEFLREPIAGIYAGLGFYQWLALLLLTVGLFQIVKRRTDTAQTMMSPKTA